MDTGEMNGISLNNTRLSRILLEMKIIPFASLGSTICLLAIFWHEASWKTLMTWSISAQLINVFGIVFIQYFKHHPNTSPSTWKPLLFIFSTVEAFVWGSAVWLFLDLNVANSSILLLATVLGSSVGGQMSRLSHRPSFTVFNLVLTGLMALRFMSLGTVFGYAAAGLCAVYGGVTFAIAQRAHDAMEKNLALNKRLVFSNAQLEVRSKELEHEKENAKAANNVKSQFLANMSHEIRKSVV